MNKKQQQFIAFVFGTIFILIMLMIAFFIPKPTDFQFLVFRIILTLSAAGVAAMIPGFLQFSVPNVLRAGGALAVFAVVYFYNPATLVINKTDSIIEPLQPQIIDHTTRTVSDSKAIIDNIHENNSKNGHVKLEQLLEGSAKDKSSRLFDVTFSNTSDKQSLLKKYIVKWYYSKGVACSIDSAATLVPIAKYVIDIPVNTDDSSTKTFNQVIYPAIVLSPGTNNNPTLVTVRLQLHYHFAGRLNYHPCTDWNIIFDVDAITQTNEIINIFKGEKWR